MSCWTRMLIFARRSRMTLLSMVAVSLLWQGACLGRPDRTRGVTVVYEIDRETLGAGEVAPDSLPWTQLVQALERRAAAGPAACEIRRSGKWQLEITIFATEPQVVFQTKRLLTASGSFELRVVANARDHGSLIESVKKQAPDEKQRLAKSVLDKEGRRVGYWASVGRMESPPGMRSFRVFVASYVIRNAATGELIERPADAGWDEPQGLEKYLADKGINAIEVLMATSDDARVTGADLQSAKAVQDEQAGVWCVDFALRPEGAKKMNSLTTSALPDQETRFYRSIGILLDGELLSAPRVMSTITDRGRITGQFTKAEVENLAAILQAGTLPIELKKTPVSETVFGP